MISIAYTYTKQDIWVGTNKGLNKINNKNIHKIESFNTDDGLISNEIREVQGIGDNLFVATKKGLSKIDS